MKYDRSTIDRALVLVAAGASRKSAAHQTGMGVGSVAYHALAAGIVSTRAYRGHRHAFRPGARPFTPEDDAVIGRMRTEGKGCVLIGRALGRNSSSIKSRIATLEQIAKRGESPMSDLYMYIDCETIPTQNPAVIEALIAKHSIPEPDLSSIDADGRLKRPETMAQGKLSDEAFGAAKVEAQAALDADIEKKRREALDKHDIALAKAADARDAEYRKLCFDGATAHIACIDLAIDDGAVIGDVNLALYGFDGRYQVPTYEEVLIGEKKMLENVFAAMHDVVVDAMRARAADARKLGRHMDMAFTPPVIVAHFAGFDVRMLWQRAKILGVTPPVWWPIDFHNYDDGVVDTMVLWCGHDSRISLDDLCVALGIPGKGDGLDGSKVWDAVQAGSIDDVQDYCVDDVERVRAVHKRLARSKPTWVTEIQSNAGRSAVIPSVDAEIDMLVAAEEAADAQHGAAAEEVA